MKSTKSSHCHEIHCLISEIHCLKSEIHEIAVAGPTSLSNIIKLGRTGSCGFRESTTSSPIHNFRTNTTTNMVVFVRTRPYSWSCSYIEQTEFASFVARMKNYLLSKVYAFRFRRRRFSQKNKQNRNFECLHLVHCRPILVMQQLFALRTLRS